MGQNVINSIHSETIMKKHLKQVVFIYGTGYSSFRYNKSFKGNENSCQIGDLSIQVGAKAG